MISGIVVLVVVGGIVVVDVVVVVLEVVVVGGIVVVVVVVAGTVDVVVVVAALPGPNVQPASNGPSAINPRLAFRHLVAIRSTVPPPIAARAAPHPHPSLERPPCGVPTK